MNLKTSKDFFNKITHIGYHSESNIIIWNEIIWNEIIKGTVDCNFFQLEKSNKSANDLILSYKIADKNILLNKEDQSFIFLLAEDGYIFYINAIHNIKKQISNSTHKCIEINVLLEEIAHPNTYPYYFVFKPNLTFKTNKEIVFNFLDKSILNTEEEITIDFYIDELATISKLEKDYIDKAKKITFVIKNNQYPFQI